MTEKPQLIDYLDYRKFLTDWINFERQANSATLVSLTKRLGFKSTSYLQKLMSGERRLSFKTAHSLAQSLELSKQDSELFVLLVAFSQAEQNDEREAIYKKILDLRVYGKVRTIVRSQFEFFKNWHLIVILEAVATDWRLLSENKMAESLKISTSELRSSLELLERIDLIKKDANGRWKRLDTNLETPAELQSLVVANYHKEMISQSLERIFKMPSDERTIEGLTIPLEWKEFEKLKAEFSDFIRKMNRKYSDSQKPAGVFHFSIMGLPLLDWE